MPQGSCAGATIFNAYCSPLGSIIPLSINGYADDHAVNKSFNPNSRTDENNTALPLEECRTEVKSWMDQVRLKLNSSKTEFIYFGNKVQVEKCCISHIMVNGERVD